MRATAKGNYIVTETNAQATGWNSRSQYPPYDGQLRQNVYAHLASGSNMVSYWHWHTLHYGQETYWRGVLGQDLEPNRIYNEFKLVAGELKKTGDRLVNLTKNNKIAILYSHDSYHALRLMPYTQKDHYPVQMIHESLYRQNIETDIVPCDGEWDFSSYKMLVIPPLYVATDELLAKIDRFVYDGGSVVMFYKSGYCNEHSAVRATLAPGPLRKACGFYYQEYGTIPALSLKDNAFGLGNEKTIGEWYEFLIPETAKPLAYADHPFFGQWPVITENNYGKGKLIYIGAYPSQSLLEKIVQQTAEEAGLVMPQSNFQFPVIFRTGKNQQGKTLHYVFNYSREDTTIQYPYPSGKELLSGNKIERNNEIVLKAWDVKIIEE
jgi:beta-galactosidase